MKNTSLTYMYRDADNYKAFQTVIFEGILSEEQRRKIFDKTDGGDFIPSQVDLDHLHENLQVYDSQDWDVDHPIHELESIEETSESPTSTCTAQEIYQRFMSVEAWDTDIVIGHILN